MENEVFGQAGTHITSCHFPLVRSNYVASCRCKVSWERALTEQPVPGNSSTPWRGTMDLWCLPSYLCHNPSILLMSATFYPFPVVFKSTWLIFSMSSGFRKKSQEGKYLARNITWSLRSKVFPREFSLATFMEQGREK